MVRYNFLYSPHDSQIHPAHSLCDFYAPRMVCDCIRIREGSSVLIDDEYMKVLKFIRGARRYILCVESGPNA